MTEDLITWLRAQLDDDARAIRRIAAASCHGIESTAEKDYFRFVDRAPAEVDAKRRILAEHIKSEYRDECRRCFDPDTAPGDYDFETFPCPTLRALALPYADRPGYREEWRP